MNLVVSVNWASRAAWQIQQTGKDVTRFVLFYKDCDSSPGITNLRHTYDTITICLKMNTFCFEKIDGLPAKF